MKLPTLIVIFLAILLPLAGTTSDTPPEKFTPAKYDPFVGDWLPANPGDCVAQVIATGTNAYQANILVAFDDESNSAPVAILRGTRPDEKSPVALRDTSGNWTGTMRPDCCGSPQLDIANSKTGEKVHLAQYMRPNPRLRAKPPEGANAIVLFADRMRDGVMMLSAADGKLTSREIFKNANARAHLEFRMLSDKSSGAVTLWKNKQLKLWNSYARDEIAACGTLETTAPSARAERAVLEWQSLDIEVKNGAVTVFLNGIKIHDSVKNVARPTGRIPLEIETRGEPMEFRNIWVK